ncbi:MAG: hypothetical protein J7604_00575 [Sporocytophaga sp.]|uniref:hypothetical protein n=1 Tax=Sporocytophaga sp. TaxID=2231183 RepID=UPI001B1B0583|nr:hypothetical protein [Sporocytophaga sp.]MBO9698664.1 hypothetical protein [Sporocytophaga sp.]
MKTDLYTKTILTIIAVCLVIIVVKQIDIIPNAHAANSDNAVYDPNYRLIKTNADGTIDVNIKSSTSSIDVNLVKVKTYDPVDVNIKKVAGNTCYDAIPVKNK